MLRLGETRTRLLMDRHRRWDTQLFGACVSWPVSWGRLGARGSSQRVKAVELSVVLCPSGHWEHRKQKCLLQGYPSSRRAPGHTQKNSLTQLCLLLQQMAALLRTSDSLRVLWWKTKVSGWMGQRKVGGGVGWGGRGVVAVNKMQNLVVISSGKSCLVLAIEGGFLPSYWFVRWNTQKSQRYKDVSTYNRLLKTQVEKNP